MLVDDFAGCDFEEMKTLGVRKLDGYRHAIRAHGLHESALVAESVFSVEGGHVAARSLIAKGATAIVAASDVMALGAIRAAHDKGLHVPRDLSVLGFDDTPLMAFTDPPLSTIRQPVRAMSDLATRLLLEQIAGGPRVNHEYQFRGELVGRGSTAPPSGQLGGGVDWLGSALRDAVRIAQPGHLDRASDHADTVVIGGLEQGDGSVAARSPLKDDGQVSHRC